MVLVSRPQLRAYGLPKVLGVGALSEEMVGCLICGASSWAGLVLVEPSCVHEGSHWQASLVGHPFDVFVVVGQVLGGFVPPDVVRCGRGEGTDWLADVPRTDLSLADFWSPLRQGGIHHTVRLNELLHFFIKPWSFPVVGEGALHTAHPRCLHIGNRKNRAIRKPTWLSSSDLRVFLLNQGQSVRDLSNRYPTGLVRVDYLLYYFL
ncbi:hypothetical protein NDU88_006491 [Pleurodeles waltl]|uniref:Uncharacterized protein n=1 Tax=Pleurodeles waltl TaxID=8319 RepID=A0AAV7NQC4_PLEWA|nr:hypothetical protein NDU88_006491 [Pleurodeles waltl]